MCTLYCNQENTNSIEISICPTLVFPLLAFVDLNINTVDNKKVYNTRVLLDTGSSVNWVAPEILRHVQYKNICSKSLEVNSFNKVEKLIYDLVEIKVNNNRLSSIKCFVMKNPNNAQIIKNLYNYVNEYADNNNIDLSSWVNPYDNENVDHDNLYIKPVYGLIVSGHYVNYIRHALEEELNESIIIKHKSLDVILKNILFGYYITGIVPVDENVSNTQMYKV